MFSFSKPSCCLCHVVVLGRGNPRVRVADTIELFFSMGRSLNSAEAGMCRRIPPGFQGVNPCEHKPHLGLPWVVLLPPLLGVSLSLDTGFSPKTHIQFHNDFTGIKETRRKKQKEGKNQLNVMYGFNRERLSSRSERYATPPPSEICSLFIIFKVSQEGN